MLNPVVLLLNKALYEFVKDDFQNHNFAPVFIDKKNCNQDTIAQSNPNIVLFDVEEHKDTDDILYMNIVISLPLLDWCHELSPKKEK